MKAKVFSRSFSVLRAHSYTKMTRISGSVSRECIADITFDRISRVMVSIQSV